MTSFASDVEFKKALSALDAVDQRVVSAKFVQHVADLSDDERVRIVLDVAKSREATSEELSGALKIAKSAALDSFTRCGADGDWAEQAGYFVAKAAAASVTPEGKGKPGGVAWQAAMASRMAKTSSAIDQGEDDHSESEHQYKILADFLDS